MGESSVGISRQFQTRPTSRAALQSRPCPLPRHSCRADASALREAFNDASYFKDEAVRAFKLGVLSLEERAQVGPGGLGLPLLAGATPRLCAGCVERPCIARARA